MKQVVIDRRYKILKKLGSGAMGVVYRVKDLKDNNIIALKILSRKKTSSETVQRFKREFKLLTELHHPNLCSVYDFGTLKDGRSYFTMEYVNGPNIFKFTKNLLPVRKNISNRVYHLIVQLCRALEYIHSKGLIHYDVKPGNVLIQRDGNETVVKLMDFGFVGEQQIKGGILIKGTFPYIAPEVIKGLAIDHRADLYSLGVLLYEIFTRKGLQKSKESFVSLLKLLQERVYEPPSRIGVNIPKALEQLIMRLIEVEPFRRFSRANEVIKEINKISGKKYEVETEKTLEGYLLSSRFVGRGKEMRVLQSLYEKARQGEGKLVLVTGNAGIGKSRLLKEFRIFTQLRRSHSFIGYAYKDRIGPLEIFHDIFRELINYVDDKSKVKQSLAVLFKIYPDLTDGHLRRHLPRLVPLEPQAEKLRTLDALTELIKYCAKGFDELVILLEDLHWADVLSVQLLEYLGRNLVESNVIICGTCRREELGNNPTLIKMIGGVKNEDYFIQIELRPLKFRSLYSLLDSTITSDSNSLELARYLMKKTAGNPFFVEEMMRTLLWKRDVNIGERIETIHFRKLALPKTIDNIVLKRIEDLDQTSQRIIKFAAILTKSFSYNLMKRLTGLDDTELSRSLWELNKRQILIEENNRYRFYHGTLRDTLNKRLGYQEKRKLNYQVGKILERINKRNLSQVVEDVAYYFINAGNKKKGVLYGLRAAKKSKERYANEQAIGFYKEVLDLLSDDDLDRRFDVLQKIAETEYDIALDDDAIRHYNKVLSLKILTIEKKIKVYSRIGHIYEDRSEYNKALQIYQRALKLLKNMKLGNSKDLLEADIKIAICSVYLMIGDYKSASKFNFDALKFPKTGLKGKEAMLQHCSIYQDMGNIEFWKAMSGKGDYEKSIFYYQRAQEYRGKIKTKAENSTIPLNLGNVYYAKFDYQRAFNCYQKGIQISEEIGNHSLVSMGLYNLGNLLIDKGCYLEALDRFQKVIFISKKIDKTLVTGSSFYAIGDCFLKLCDLEKSKEYHKKALEIFNTISWEFGRLQALLGIGNIYQVMGDYAMAMRYYRKSLKISKNTGHPDDIATSFMNIDSVLIEIGEFSKAKRYIEDALKIAIAIKEKKIELGCYIHLGRISVMMKNFITAIGYYKAGIKLARKIGMRQESSLFFLLGSEIHYHENKYLQGIKTANKAIKLAKDMGTKDIHAEALRMKAKNEMKRGVLLNIEILTILDEARRIAEEINFPEVLWKIYFTYGKFFQKDRQYPKALEYYQKCHRIFSNIGSKIESETYRMSYLSRSDRQAVYTAKKEIKNLFR